MIQNDFQTHPKLKPRHPNERRMWTQQGSCICMLPKAKQHSRTPSLLFFNSEIAPCRLDIFFQISCMLAFSI